MKIKLFALCTIFAFLIACGDDDDPPVNDGNNTANNTANNAPTNNAPTNNAPTNNAPTNNAPTNNAPTNNAPTNNATNNPTNNMTGGDACDNTSDLDELANNIEAIEEASGDCGMSCIADSDIASCAGECIEMTEGVNLSRGCADCFGAVVECTVDNCLTQCIADPSSTECVMCRETNCDPVFEACAGVAIP